MALLRALSILLLAVAAACTNADRTVVVDVQGMHCESCVNAITETVSAMEGVRSVEVSLEAERASVVAGPGVKDAALEAAIRDLGYEAKVHVASKGGRSTGE